MSDISQLDSSTVQNLKDAGCSNDFIERFARITEKEKIDEQLSLLAKHRSELLDNVHKNQKRIDCLDYLIYKIKKQS